MKMTTEPGFTWIPPSEVKRRLDTIPLPRKLKSRFLHVVITWQSSSGTEWTVGRLKSFKDCLLNSWANGGVLSTKPEWFATTPTGMLSGVWGQIWSLAMKDSSSLKACLFMVNIYTATYRSETTRSVMDDISSSISERPKVTIPHRGKISWGAVTKALHKLGFCNSVKLKCPPSPLNVVPPSKVSHIVQTIRDVTSMSNLPLLTQPEVRLLRESMGVDGNVGGNMMWSSTAGSIHMTHEPGLKTRYFAAPNLVAQRALEPFKDSLIKFLNRVPWDCTLNQRAADNDIMSHLRSGETVYSVDLSSATDAFPWEWQKCVGRQVAGNNRARHSMRLMTSLVEMCEWELPDGDSLMFSAGQPLGLGPSFPLFTLSHGVLLYILNGYRWDRQFYVLGDDVIIFDGSLAAEYRKVIQNWGVEVSETKSFTSPHLAQFAGVTYTSTESFWVPKWRPFTRANLLDAEAWWYPGLTEGLPDHSLIKRVLSLPEPYGLGRNPDGIPLAERFSTYLVDEILGREQRRVDAIRRRSTRVDTSVYSQAARDSGIPGSTLKDFVLKMQDASSWSRRFPAWVANHNPTGLSLPEPLSILMHGTDAPGFPELRVKTVRFDPYSVGNLKSWKQLFRRVEEAKASVEAD